MGAGIALNFTLRHPERVLGLVLSRPAWLDAPNPAFEGLKPLEVIERGQVDRLWQMVFLVESGTPS